MTGMWIASFVLPLAAAFALSTDSATASSLYHTPSVQGEQDPSADRTSHNFVDLSRMAGSKVDDAVRGWLAERGLREGPNEDGTSFVAVGRAEVAVPTTSPQWVVARCLAYDAALMSAREEMVKYLGVELGNESQTDMIDDPFGPGDGGEVSSLAEAIAQKAQLVEVTELDAELAELGVPADAIERLSVPQKHVEFRHRVMNRFVSTAAQRVAGLRALTTVEGDGDGGAYSVAVICRWSQVDAALASTILQGGSPNAASVGKRFDEVLAGEGGSVPSTGQELTDRLADQFGVRLVTDADGHQAVIAFGQDGPSLNVTESAALTGQKIRNSRSRAIQMAQGALAQFLNSTLNLEDETIRRQVWEKLVIRRGDRLEIPADTAQFVNRLQKEASAFARVELSGVHVLKNWQGNHPVFGHPVVGVVLMWSPRSDELARLMRSVADNPGLADRLPGRSAAAARPSSGVRVADDFERPTANAAEPSSAPRRDAPGTRSVEVFGFGADDREAIDNALVEAVRQVLGATVDADQTLRTRAQFMAADLKESNTVATDHAAHVRVATKGVVRSYRVLSRDLDERGMRVRVAVDVGMFDAAALRRAPWRIVVLPFESASGTLTSGIDGRVERLAVDLAPLGSAIDATLRRHLLQSQRFDVLERDALAEVQAELDRIGRGETPHDDLVRLRQRVSADFILIGAVRRADLAARFIDLSGATWGFSRQMSYDVAVDCRIVEVPTGRVEDMQTFSFVASDRKPTHVDAQNVEVGELFGEIADMAALALADAMLDRAHLLLVAKVDPEGFRDAEGALKAVLYLNQGGSRFRRGDLFEIWSVGEAIPDPADPTRSLGSDEELVAEIQITDVKQTFVKGVLLAGDAQRVAVGSITRRKAKD